MNYDLEISEVDRLIDLLHDHRRGVESGDIVPDQPREYELEEIDALIQKLWEGKWR